MTPRELALAIVDEYGASYGGKSRAAVDPVTQSAIATANTQVTEELCAPVEALMYDPAPPLRAVAQLAVDRSLAFQYRDYRDLGSFASALA